MLTQLNSALSGRYTIEREIGRGGMATVYLARDVRHDRRVALKVLDPELAAVVGVERFLAEIRVTANLQHPNILPLFDSGEASGQLFYVMPYVEGESLRALLVRERQLPIDDAIHIATAIAGALENAHRRGVIHRDLKPENILLHDGQPLLADFGIALALSNAGGSRITQTGISLGTPQYMSPEQATGDRAIDGRTDIYSLGAVLYEMLAGEPPHSGTSAQAVIAKVITDRPRSLSLARDTTPPHIEAAVGKALAKLPADRFATASQFADALLGKAVLPSPSVLAPRSTAWRSQALLLGIISIALIATTIAITSWLSRRDAPAQPVRFVIALPDSTEMVASVPGSEIALSPDGQWLAVVSRVRNQNRTFLFVRAIGSLEMRALPGSDGAYAPFFSPDGKWIAFASFLDLKLKKVAIDGTGLTVLADGSGFRGGSWSDGKIVYAAGRSLVEISEAGGTPRPIKIDGAARDMEYFWPMHVGTDGAVVAAVTSPSLPATEIVAISRAGRLKRLGLVGTAPRPFKGRLIFTRADGSVLAAPFDEDRLEVIGEPQPTGETTTPKYFSAANLALARNGTAVLMGSHALNRPVLVSRTGETRPIAAIEPRPYMAPRFSPDGRKIAFNTRPAMSQDLFIYDVRSATMTRLASAAGLHYAEWSPDGRRIAYTAIMDSTGENMYAQPADGSAGLDLLVGGPGDQYDGSWVPDGKGIVFAFNEDDLNASDIGLARFGDDSSVTTLISAPGQQLAPRVSPNGDLITYISSESGRYEVYVTTFPKPSARVQVSATGGVEPMWSRDGRELFYRDGERMMVARVSTEGELAVSNRRALFEGPFVADGTHTWYDVSRDGQSFVMLQPTSNQNHLVAILHWDVELGRRARSR